MASPLFLGHDFDTTGVLGVSAAPDGGLQARGFPTWATLPREQWLAMGRRWHFFFAWILVFNGLAYLASGLSSGHFRRDLLPTSEQLRHIARTIWYDLRLRFPKGEEARRYNVLQKAGLSGCRVRHSADHRFGGHGDVSEPGQHSPTARDFDPGGRRIGPHDPFPLCGGVGRLLTGPHIDGPTVWLWNNLRSMITGRYLIEEARNADD